MKKLIGLCATLLGVFFLIGLFAGEETQYEETSIMGVNTEETKEVEPEHEEPDTVDVPTEDSQGNVTESVGEDDLEETEVVVEKEEAMASAQTLSSTYEVVKKGRGNADVGRNEPEYQGMTGYVALSTSDIQNEYEVFPSYPWSVQAVEPSGTAVDELTKTSVRIPHKTKVKVLEQHLTHKRYGNYDGWLLVQSVEDANQTYKIDVHDFVTYAYWDRHVHDAAQMGPAIAVYNGKGAKPYKDDGEVDVAVGTEVYLSGTEYGGDVTAFVYREWRLGYGGIEVTFDPISLDIVY